MPEAFDDLRMSVDRFCLLAGLEVFERDDVGGRGSLVRFGHARSGRAQGPSMGHDPERDRLPRRQVKVERPRVRDFAGREMSLPSWELLSEPELLQAWAMNLMVINVSTRKYARAVRPPGRCGRRSAGGIG